MKNTRVLPSSHGGRGAAGKGVKEEKERRKEKQREDDVKKKKKKKKNDEDKEDQQGPDEEKDLGRGRGRGMGRISLEDVSAVIADTDLSEPTDGRDDHGVGGALVAEDVLAHSAVVLFCLPSQNHKERKKERKHKTNDQGLADWKKRKEERQTFRLKREKGAEHLVQLLVVSSASHPFLAISSKTSTTF